MARQSELVQAEDNAAVEIAGTFTSPIDLDLSAATLTITNLLNEQAGSGELVQRAAARPDGCSGKPPQVRAIRRSVAPEHRFGDDPRHGVGHIHLQDQSQRRDHHLSPELFTDSTHDQLPSRRCGQAAHRRQHGTVVGLLRPVEQVSQDSLSGSFRRKEEEGGNTMNRMIRSLCSTLGKAIVLCAFALALAGRHIGGL